MGTRKFVQAALGVAIGLTALTATSARAQDGSLTGVVTDAASKQPIGAVQVQIQGTTRGATTSEAGRYTIANLAPGSYTVTFRRVGYTPYSRENVQVAAGAATTADAALTVSVLRLQSMIVTASSDPIEGLKAPYSVGRVTAEDIKAVPTTNSAAAAIQGKVAGVSIIRGSGQPGDGVQVQLRTPQNIKKGNSPMYVVDGVVLGSTFDGTTVDLEALDIESVEVIKGASAAALYGSRAANGVISIRTSRGASLPEGSTRISTRSEFGQSYAPQNIDVSQHHQFEMNAAGQFVTPQGNPTTSRSNRGLSPDGFIDNPYPGQTFNNIERFFNPGSFNTHSLNLSQNSTATNFLISANQKKESGTLAADRGLVQRSGRVNLDHRLGEDISFSVSAFHSRSVQGNNQGAAFRTLLTYDSDVDIGVKDADGKYLQLPDPSVPLQNPLWSQQNSSIGDNKRARTLASVDGRYNPLGWLSFSTNLSYDRSDLLNDRYTAKGTPNSVTAETVTNGSLSYTDETTDALNGSVSATGLGTFGGLTARLTTSAIAEREWNLSFSASGSNFTTNDVPDLSNAQTAGSSSGLLEIRSEGYSANLGLDYEGKYILDLVARRDGSSLFGPSARWGNYGRVAAAYRISEEPWYPLVGIIDELKFRYAIGTAGTRPSFDDQYETWDVAAGTITKNTLGNRRLQPAVTTEQEHGIDFVIKDRYSVELSYIKSKTVDQVSDVILPAVSGYGQQWQNTGTTQGHVWEATIQAQWVNRPSFTWSSTFIADRTRTKILAWNTSCELGTLTYYCDGFSLADMYGQHHVRSLADLPPRFAGAENMFQINDDGYLVPVGVDGDWRDISKYAEKAKVTVNGVALDWGLPIIAENEDGTRHNSVIGNSLPDAQVGWLNNFSWHGVRLHTQFHAQIGGEVYNQTKQRMYQDNRHGDLDQFGKPNETKKPFGYYANLYNRNDVTKIFVEDGSYLKLRELAVSYRLTKEQLGRVGIGKWAPEGIALGLIGRNLWTVTGYSGWDPEVGSPTLRYDNFSYPPPKALTGSVEITF
jgi:TonB-linked SusC/RagA family outer membrane protein